MAAVWRRSASASSRKFGCTHAIEGGETDTRLTVDYTGRGAGRHHSERRPDFGYSNSSAAAASNQRPRIS